MQFKYPEILYFLLLLLIPIFIHLFQLRKFEKIAFTNVDFLKKVELQTRKSSRLKKFLILLSRLGLFAAMILAFAQPYISNNKQTLKPKIILYLDNSLSMQAKNGTNELFKDAVQEIITSYGKTPDLSLLTNDGAFNSLSNKELKNQLLSLEYSHLSKDLNTVLLQANKKMKTTKDFKNHLVLISDFQSKNISKKLSILDDIEYSFVQLKSQEQKNISIDSVYIAKQDGLNINLNVVIKSYNIKDENLSVSLFKDKILTGKTTCELEKNKKQTVSFKIPFNDSFNGKIVIEDNLISFDNELFFSLNKQEKINVLAIGDDNEFLTKIYTNSEFELISNKLNQVDYNKILNQNLIVLNELETIPLSLQKNLKKFVLNGGSLVVIPSNNLDLNNYNQLFTNLEIGSISDKIKAKREVTSINFSHPILDNVFEKKIKNFQYPNVESSYGFALNKPKAILKFDNQKSFISEIKKNKGKVYCLSSSINKKNSNFKASPLIVPVFYNFGKQSYNLTELYYTIGQNNKIDIKTKIVNDEVLLIKSGLDNDVESFIPLQQVSQQKVVLQIEDNPLKSGFFKVTKKDELLKNIAFNYDRSESETHYANIENILKDYKNVSFSTSINKTFNDVENNYKIASYWKWFIALAILFLIIEILLIRLFNT